MVVAIIDAKEKDLADMWEQKADFLDRSIMISGAKYVLGHLRTYP